MRYARSVALPGLATLVLLSAPAPAQAVKGQPGGVTAPSVPKAGGSQYGVPLPKPQLRPVVSSLSVPATAKPGRPPRVSFRIAEAGVGTVNAQVAIGSLSTRREVVVVRLGWVHTGRTVLVRWPSSTTLTPGSYHVSVSAHDHHGVSVLRRAHSSGVAGLIVKAPTVAPLAPALPTPEAGVPTPAETVADGAVFPVAGAHSFGGPENRYGAPRDGHIHEGQDVLTAEGTPDVAPLAGTITTTGYQAAGAGYYAVEHTGVGLDFMFAHCEAASLAVAEGQPVIAGQLLCKAGQTGDATAPHLHFEIWVGGWQSAAGHSIDPLPYLEAWER
jgi:Peptidase family M23